MQKDHLAVIKVVEICNFPAQVKFRLSEKHTKFEKIILMVLTFT